MMLKVIFFDLDDTLYPMSSGIHTLLGDNIQRFVMQHINITWEQAVARRKVYRERYGTALRGMIEEGVPFDLEHFFSDVHDIPIEQMIAPRPEVGAMLDALPLRKAIHTNSNIEHAMRVLRHLKLESKFERVFDIKALNLINKPHAAAYEFVCRAMGVALTEAVLVEDSVANSRSAKALGMTTILVDQPPSDAAHWFVTDVAQVADVLKTFVQP